MTQVRNCAIANAGTRHAARLSWRLAAQPNPIGRSHYRWVRPLVDNALFSADPVDADA